MQFLKTLALVILFSITNSFLHAQNIINVKSALSKNYFGKNVYLYQDPTNKLTFEQIRRSANLFKANNLDVPNLGITEFNNWVKFTLVNDTDLDKVILNISNPIIDEADLYIIKGDQVDSIKNSNFRPLGERQYDHQFYLFDIHLKKGESADFYLKLKSNQQILAPLSLETPRALLTDLSDSDTRSGIYLGIMVVMFI